MTIDYKKVYRALNKSCGSDFILVDGLTLKSLMVDRNGNPNFESFDNAVESLYSFA